MGQIAEGYVAATDGLTVISMAELIKEQATPKRLELARSLETFLDCSTDEFGFRLGYALYYLKGIANDTIDGSTNPIEVYNSFVEQWNKRDDVQYRAQPRKGGSL